MHPCLFFLGLLLGLEIEAQIVDLGPTVSSTLNANIYIPVANYTDECPLVLFKKYNQNGTSVNSDPLLSATAEPTPPGSKYKFLDGDMIISRAQVEDAGTYGIECVSRSNTLLKVQLFNITIRVATGPNITCQYAPKPADTRLCCEPPDPYNVYVGWVNMDKPYEPLWDTVKLGDVYGLKLMCLIDKSHMTILTETIDPYTFCYPPNKSKLIHVGYWGGMGVLCVIFIALFFLKDAYGNRDAELYHEFPPIEHPERYLHVVA